MKNFRITSMYASLALLAAGALSSFTTRLLADRETRSVGSFTEISLGSSSHVVVKQGSPQSVAVEGSKDDLADFETTVQGGKLRLNFRNQEGKMFNNKSHGPVTVYVTVPTLTALRVGGSGKLEMSGPLQADALTLTLSGSGDLVVPQLQAKQLETSVSGSGGVMLGGNCASNDIRISGSGKVKAHDLKTETSRARISGSGDVHVYASRTAEGSISGSGSLYVAGGAQLSSNTHGSGRVVKE
ncbi:head GIN domain-containing protein [Hymenobacter convexus]|uniref:head GIN domain-containing protein n=1 Tax=Hymenobacter sp. CA1UV-4 TaxID=3063782 RepID=UPI002713808B|nr:head GIN domain-containing protein [Hymenobacter sp. CA1UV-4]MDO7851040.1 head GIN domain-containing protein [Hymenobacter sp. CA1UV-4]